jgi:hypothetical protein
MKRFLLALLFAASARAEITGARVVDVTNTQNSDGKSGTGPRKFAVGNGSTLLLAREAASGCVGVAVYRGTGSAGR